MAEQTIADRIMAAADAYVSAAVSTHAPYTLTSPETLLAHERYARHFLASLVAEACAPPPEQVCRWTRAPSWYRPGCKPEELVAFLLGEYCPGCGGRVERAAMAAEAGGGNER